MLKTVIMIIVTTNNHHGGDCGGGGGGDGNANYDFPSQIKLDGTFDLLELLFYSCTSYRNTLLHM